MNLASRYEPKNFSDLVFADIGVQRLLALYANGLLHENIILHGPYGTAKSKTAEIIVEDRRRLGKISGHFLGHLHPATMSKLPDAVTGPLNYLMLFEPSPQPYLIIDEVDQMTSSEQLKLRALIDQHSSLRLIMTTNNFGKVDAGIRSRSQCVEIGMPSAAALAPRAQSILAKEGIALSLIETVNLIQDTKDLRHMLRRLELCILEHQRTSQPSPVEAITRQIQDTAPARASTHTAKS